MSLVTSPSSAPARYPYTYNSGAVRDLAFAALNCAVDDFLNGRGNVRKDAESFLFSDSREGDLKLWVDLAGECAASVELSRFRRQTRGLADA